MGAYNWIDFNYTCPSCKQLALIRSQTHIASSHAGDETGRFSDRTYKIGEKMAWWPRSHKDYEEWREDSEPNQKNNEAVEACYSKCSLCSAELYAIIKFNEVKPTEVFGVGLQAQWPEGYLH